ncbi:MAG: ketoacyl-ACP synthase III [Porticoccaceae bacterium]
MKHAAITGWGKCLPPAVVTNDDLATFLDTSDEWITTRTGMKERRISHVGVSELGYVAAARALACADLDPKDLDMVVLASCTTDSGLPNSASLIQQKLGADNAGCYDINTACTGFMYGLSTAAGLIKTGVIKNAVVVGAEVMSQPVPWHDRSISVLFGDGAAAWVLQASDKHEGVLTQKLGCMSEDRDILAINYGFTPPGEKRHDLAFWKFQGQDIFKKAVNAMAAASIDVIAEEGITADQVALCIPHQANKRIIDAVAKKAGIPPERCYVNVHRYGNVSAATVPVATVEALEEHRIKAGDYILMPAFGAGLTWSAHLIKWGERLVPLKESSAELPPCEHTGLELIYMIMEDRGEPLTPRS